MATRFTSGAPAQPERQLSAWLPQIRRAASISSGVGPSDLIDDYELSDGYEVRYVDPGRLGSGDLTNAVHSRRWRFLIWFQERPLGEFELDNALDPIAFHEGAAKSGFLEALDQAEQLPGDFEASVLTASALRFVGLWLEGENDDWIIPYPPNATQLPNFSTIRLQDAVATLRQIAAELPDLTDPNDTRGG